MDRLQKIKLAIQKGITCNPETGEVFGLKGQIYNQRKNEYIYFRVYQDKKAYKIMAHQFIWYIVHNEIAEQIDHIDGNKINNKIKNLRAVNNQQNSFNQKAKGYSFYKRLKKYHASITINRKKVHLGYFDLESDARNAYLEAKKIYHKI